MEVSGDRACAGMQFERVFEKEINTALSHLQSMAFYVGRITKQQKKTVTQLKPEA